MTANDALSLKSVFKQITGDYKNEMNHLET